jgi:flagellar hook protein FlgE
MDVIGNNIANVNTTAYKSQSMVFSDLLYQTTQAASGANASTGRGGINARQIGLGSKTGAISTSITTQGSAQSTNNPFDVMISGDAFFIVSDGSQNFFTRDGSFTVDGAGNLVMSTTGYTVMGWQTDENGDIIADTVSALQIMNAANLTYPAESTTAAYVSGIIDQNDSQLSTTAGRIMTLNFYDEKGYEYTAKFSVHKIDDDNYNVSLDDILNDDGVSLVDEYNLNSITDIANFGTTTTSKTEKLYTLPDDVTYDTASGKYKKVIAANESLQDFSSNAMIKLSNGNWSITTPAANAAVTAGTANSVTVEGSITLDKDTLQGDPFNLILEQKADGSYAYYYQASTASNTTPVKGQEVTDWATALAKLNVTNVSNPVVDADGNLTLDFTQTFTPSETGTVSADGKSIEAEITALEAFGLQDSADTTYTVDFTSQDGKSAQIIATTTTTGNTLMFDPETGKFTGIGTIDNDKVDVTFNSTATSKKGDTVDLTAFSNISVDFSQVFSSNNGGISTASATSGDLQGYNTGRKYGEMTGVEIGQDGKIRASYDNGQTKLLGQISVATFANASGLSKQGNNLYSATMNSGDFDGIGSDITSGGGSMESGVLEMSNVDLSSEFTEMITTQRGFQANSRIITVSDTMLEELVNLKR